MADFNLRLVTASPTSKGFHRRIANRTITGAATKIARELFVEIVVSVEVIAIVTLEHRTDETGRAVAALRAKMLNHLLLHGMETWGLGIADAFDRHDFASGDKTDGRLN